MIAFLLKLFSKKKPKYHIKCPPDCSCVDDFSITQNQPVVLDGKGYGPKGKVSDYRYDEDTCTYSWKTEWDFEQYKVTARVTMVPTEFCTGANLDYTVFYDFVDTYGVKNQCSFHYERTFC